MTVCFWFVPYAERKESSPLLFSAGSNIIIRPQSSLGPSRCGRQRDVSLTQAAGELQRRALFAAAVGMIVLVRMTVGEAASIDLLPMI